MCVGVDLEVFFHTALQRATRDLVGVGLGFVVPLCQAVAVLLQAINTEFPSLVSQLGKALIALLEDAETDAGSACSELSLSVRAELYRSELFQALQAKQQEAVVSAIQASFAEGADRRSGGCGSAW